MHLFLAPLLAMQTGAVLLLMYLRPADAETLHCQLACSLMHSLAHLSAHTLAHLLSLCSLASQAVENAASLLLLRDKSSQPESNRCIIDSLCSDLHGFSSIRCLAPGQLLFSHRSSREA